MKKLNLLCLAPVLMLGSLTWAEPKTPVYLDAAKFDGLTVEQMDSKSIYLTHPKDQLEEFGDWAKNSPDEKSALLIYPDYVEPVLTNMKNGQRKTLQERIVMFVTKAKLVLNKAPGDIQIGTLINIDNIRKVDGEIEHNPIQPNQFMGNVVGKGQIENFKWGKCKDNVLRPAKEIELNHTNPAGRPAWCSDTAHSICLESCYAFGELWRQGVNLVNLAVDASEKKDLGIGMQSEIRFFADEKELGGKVPLAKLSHINTAVRGVMEQNMFYFNQVIQFGKVLAFIQDHPADPKKSVATLYFAVGVNRRTYKKHNEVGKILLGKSYLNTKTGITAGLPIFTINTVNAISAILEK